MQRLASSVMGPTRTPEAVLEEILVGHPAVVVAGDDIRVVSPKEPAGKSPINADAAVSFVVGSNSWLPQDCLDRLLSHAGADLRHEVDDGPCNPRREPT